MGILIGMDEAGYGPNLGPLVVAATAWEVADGPSQVREPASPGLSLSKSAGRRRTNRTARSTGSTCVAEPPGNSLSALCEIDLYRTFRGVVARKPSERRISIGDSKVLYRPGLGLRQLERGVHAIFALLQQSQSCWSAMVANSAADPAGHHLGLPWHQGFDCRLPIDASNEELGRLSDRFARACEATRVRPLAIRARMVFPAEFNELVEYYGTKGGALSHVTVGLLREVMDLLARRDPPAACGEPSRTEASSPVFVVCDKHGGRNYYTALLQHHFSEHWIEPVYESRAESRYEWGPENSRIRATFRVGGEQFLPTALASMTAKYLRELAMRAFNEFWCAKVPKLKPTAGYYNDAWRFKKETADAQRSLRIEDRIVWRER
jgi:hypothetical protein